jgi:hypothetical protein
LNLIFNAGSGELIAIPFESAIAAGMRGLRRAVCGDNIILIFSIGYHGFNFWQSNVMASKKA